MTRLVLLRHGESEWNHEGRFAGWIDVALNATGIEQARRAGSGMRAEGLDFDVCYTSVLKRATHTAWHCLDAMDRTWLPVTRSWRLNERHYGALHGLNKSACAREFGEEQLRLWRRSYATRPPVADGADTIRFDAERRYRGVPIPVTESLQDTVARVRVFWEESIRPAVESGSRVLVVAHGTSLRALVKILRDVPEDEIARMEIPNGVPLVFNVEHEGRDRLPANGGS
jgi:2,3-bisphosphoglycerate-dependent phosphoglycerate mutase